MGSIRYRYASFNYSLLLNLCIFLSSGCGKTGASVQLDGRRPKICYKDRMVPICGYYFKDNNEGARLFCELLGKQGGVVYKTRKRLQEDAYMVGKCNIDDTHINACSQECNCRQLGGKCSWWRTANCNRGSRGVIYVDCNGKCFSYVFSIFKTFRSILVQ